MQTSYLNLFPDTTRPSIVEVVTRYTALRKTGKEYKGRCVFHADAHPSLSINEDRGVFHCFGCGEGGDVLTFIQLVEGVDFKGALAVLGMGGDPPRPRHTPARQVAVSWARDQIELMNARLRELDEGIEDADELDDVELAESLWRERRILADLRDDFGCPQYFVELKDLIEKITGGFEYGK